MQTLLRNKNLTSNKNQRKHGPRAKTIFVLFRLLIYGDFIMKPFQTITLNEIKWPICFNEGWGEWEKEEGRVAGREGIKG